MAKTKAAKSPANNRNNKKQKLGLKPKNFPSQSQQKQENPIISKPINKNPNSYQDEDPILFGSSAGADESGSGSESESESESDSPLESSSPTLIQSVLEPYTKAQLVEFLLDAALSDPELRARIRTVADADVSHRRIFLVGIRWDDTKEHLIEVLSAFGPIEVCNIPVDHATGRGKGYAFVLFKDRSGAMNALKEPQKWIGSRLTTCRMASVGRGNPDIRGRKIYVDNVPPGAQQKRLKEFFAKFGKIVSAVMGFDAGKARGYAIFVYKTQEGAKKALEEPLKMFDGHKLFCNLAVASTGEVQRVAAPVSNVQTVAPAATASVTAQTVVPQQSVLAAVATAQNPAFLGQNPAYAALSAHDPLGTAATWNPSLGNMAARIARIARVSSWSLLIWWAVKWECWWGFRWIQVVLLMKASYGDDIRAVADVRTGDAGDAVEVVWRCGGDQQKGRERQAECAGAVSEVGKEQRADAMKQNK